jgi:hypothetical protein
MPLNSRIAEGGNAAVRSRPQRLRGQAKGEPWRRAIRAVDRPYTVGVRTTGPNGGEMRADVSSEGVQFSPGNIDDCATVLEFDPATLVLTGYARMNGGTARGDEELAGKFRELFFPI